MNKTNNLFSLSGSLCSESNNTEMNEASFDVFLVDEGYLSPEGLARAHRVMQETGGTLPHVLARLGLIAPAKLADACAKHLNIRRLLTEDFPEHPVDLPGLNPAFFKSCKVLPASGGSKDIPPVFALADPYDDYVQRSLAFALGVPFALAVSTEDEIDAAVDQLYFHKGGDAEEEETLGWISGDVERLRELASDAPVIKYVDRLIDEAIGREASDIHLEPIDTGLRVRLRLNGVLEETEQPPAAMASAVISRIKIMSGLNIAERRLAQDGRMRHRAHGRQVDFRVATGPTAQGESIVLRLLDKTHVPLDFSSLGFNGAVQADLEGAISCPDGIVLVTGPTGSGKTTTLYAALNQLNSTESKILSVEDPVEYMLKGVNQVQVDSHIGRTFASTLRSFLRQDPDIIMVGEIRDGETAGVAVQAALTGHLVLSTLHTNSAAAAITRLLDMGVDDYLIASALRVTVAQRLVRMLCPSCKQEWQPDNSMLERLHLPPETRFYRAKEKGCSDCGGKGYSRRTSLIEILPITDAIRQLILARSETSAIHRAAEEAGMVSLLMDGLQKAQQGLVSLEDVLRVTKEH